MIFSESNAKEYNVLMELLSCVDGPDDGEDVTDNSRKIVFIDVPSNFGEMGYVDLWRNNYKIFIDTNYDGKQVVGGKERNGPVFVYSYGKNKKDDEGKIDDICSWE
jgi:hypothetical protein